MRFITFLSMLLAFAMLAATPDISDARVRHIPSMRHAKSQNEQNTVQEQQTTDIREVHNNFFSVSLPEGWKLQKPVVPVADRVSAVFMKGDFTRISLNIFKIPFTKQLMAEKTADSMRKRDMEVSRPVEEGDFYVVDIAKNGVTGKGWFGKNGAIGASTVIFAPDLTEANELLECLKTSTPHIVPEKVE